MSLEVRLRLERNDKPLYIKFVILAVGELSLRRISMCEILYWVSENQRVQVRIVLKMT